MFGHVDRAALLDGEIIGETVVRHVPCSTIGDAYREVSDVAVVRFGLKFNIFHSLPINLVLLIRTTGPGRTFAGKIDIDFGVDDLAAVLRVIRRVRCLEDDVTRKDNLLVTGLVDVHE